MAYRVEWDEGAHADLDEILGYLCNVLFSNQAAETLLGRLEAIDAVQRTLPKSYPHAADPYLRRRGYRSARAGGYLVLYRIAEYWASIENDEVVEGAGIGGCEGIVRVAQLRHVSEDWEETL